MTLFFGVRNFSQHKNEGKKTDAKNKATVAPENVPNSSWTPCTNNVQLVALIASKIKN